MLNIQAGVQSNDAITRLAQELKQESDDYAASQANDSSSSGSSRGSSVQPSSSSYDGPSDSDYGSDDVERFETAYDSLSIAQTAAPDREVEVKRLEKASKGVHAALPNAGWSALLPKLLAPAPAGYVHCTSESDRIEMLKEAVARTRNDCDKDPKLAIRCLWPRLVLATADYPYMCQRLGRRRDAPGTVDGGGGDNSSAEMDGISHDEDLHPLTPPDSTRVYANTMSALAPPTPPSSVIEAAAEAKVHGAKRKRKRSSLDSLGSVEFDIQ
ncbi:hypothetical protein L1887_53395 [Cichorium endivia]|nr:hypothetical protein L1887_53395 [Cichorium endivia]